MNQMTYTGTGVDTGALNRLKRLAQESARKTAGNPLRLCVHLCADTIGESVQLYRNGDHYIGHLNEGLGTKNIAAEKFEREMFLLPSYFGDIAQDTFAMIVNDMATLGCIPFGVAMHIEIGDKKWMNDQRVEALIAGWKYCCDMAGCAWGGGETAILRDIIDPETASLSGSAVGKTIGLTRFSGDAIRPGDAIVFFESSGIHANGLTLARDLAAKLPQGYLTPVPRSFKSFGDLLLQPTHIYAPAIEAFIRGGIEVHYATNITGEGWRKIMRSPLPLTYVIDHLPTRRPIFDFIQKHGNVSDREMFSSLNMGVGYAVMVAERSLPALWDCVKKNTWPFRVFEAGHIEAGPRQVVIHPMDNMTFEALDVR